MNRLTAIGISVLLFLSACTEKRYRVHPLPEPVDISIERYDKQLFEEGEITDTAFLPLYVENILEIGLLNDPQTLSYLERFREDSDLIHIYEDVLIRFTPKDIKSLSKKLTAAFKRLCWYVPHMPIPQIGLHISGFGQSIVSAPEILSASIEKFLGPDYPPYEELFYEYQTIRMDSKRLTADFMNGWIRSEFNVEEMAERGRMIDFLIYEGKVLFLLEKVLPKEPFEYLTGWSHEQKEWCQANEANMWQRINEFEQLHMHDDLIVLKYFGEAPSTAYFPEESPGRAAIQVGYGIVKAYMERHPKATLMDMMMETDADKILKESLYRPE